MSSIETALAILQSGGLVAIPTETVYGLAADATNEKAILSVFQTKGRPIDHPLIVHIAQGSNIFDWARECPDGARQLMDAFWPGPLTLILPKQLWVSDLITAKQDSVGLRCPDHPLTQALLAALAKGVVAPSANRFGKVSPTTAQHVIDEFGDQVVHIVDGGACRFGIESTIIDYTRGYPVLLRPGHIRVTDIEAVSGQMVCDSDNKSPKAPGTLAAHYAPNTAMLLLNQKALLQHIIENRIKSPSAILAYSLDSGLPELASSRRDIFLIKMPNDPVLYAKLLYSTLRKLDHQQLDIIYVEEPPKDDAWSAINNRLSSAVKGSHYQA